MRWEFSNVSSFPILEFKAEVLTGDALGELTHITCDAELTATIDGEEV